MGGIRIMNERIKQIANDAGFPEWCHRTVGFELEQFAELIVKECISCASEWNASADEHISTDSKDYWNGYRHGCDDAIVEMETRFGIEE